MEGNYRASLRGKEVFIGYAKEIDLPKPEPHEFSGTYTGTINLSQKDSEALDNWIRKLDQQYIELRNRVINEACKGEYDTEFHREMVGIVMDTHYGKHSVELESKKVKYLLDKNGFDKIPKRYTFLCTQNMDACAVFIQDL